MSAFGSTRFPAHKTINQVKFILEVTLADTDQPRDELGRILRYWAGAMKQLDGLKPGDAQDIYDSAYAKVGSWRVTE